MSKSPYTSMRLNGKHVLVHRVVMAQVLGRPLSRLEFIHHINGDGKDNRPENLELVTVSRHTSRHPSTPEHMEALWASRRGVPLSPEAIAKRTATVKQGYIDHPERRAARSAFFKNLRASKFWSTRKKSD